MSSKKKTVLARMEKHRDLILVAVPLIVATLIVVLQLVPADLLGYFSDAYTVALLFSIFIVAVLMTRRHRG